MTFDVFLPHLFPQKYSSERAIFPRVVLVSPNIISVIAVINSRTVVFPPHWHISLMINNSAEFWGSDSDVSQSAVSPQMKSNQCLPVHLYLEH